MKNFAHLRPGSPFYAVFKKGRAPVRHFMARPGRFVGADDEDFYELDVAQLSEAQIKTIAQMLADRPDAPGSAIEAEAYMRKEGFLPLRAQHVAALSADLRAFV